MGFELKQNIKTIQRLSLSAELKNSIAILALERSELENYLLEELSKNPCLTGLGKTLKSSSGTLGTPNNEQIKSRDMADQTASSNLHINLLEQITMFRLSHYEQTCCKIIVQYLDDNGYISTNLEELANIHKIPKDDLSFALEIMQKRCDPPGIGAHDIQECLLIQAKRLPNTPNGVETILKDYWDEFKRMNLPKLAKVLECSLEEVKEIFRFIRENLDPKPARQFGENPNSVVVPDVYVFEREGELICSLNQNGLPRVKLSKHYQSLLEELKNNQNQKETLKYLNENTRSAKWLIRALEERNKTILRVTESIIKYQKDFFTKGPEFLVPITLKDVAEELGLHESTISRSTSGKFLFCQRGIFELKYFFNSKVESKSGKELANESIKQWVLEFIKQEDKDHCLSDQDIADKIALEKNVKIARRTVSKYREELKILPSSKRSKKF